jgi:hypothetical protein
MKHLPHPVVRKLAMAAALSVLLSTAAAAATVKAVESDRFVDFIGVQGSLDAEDAIWGSGATTWKARLAELGIRYMRTSIRTSTAARDKAKAIYNELGVRLNVVINPRRADGSLNANQIAPFMDFLRNQVGMEKVSSIEGPNEFSSTKYKGNADWVTELRSFQAKLYQNAKGDPRSRPVPVTAPTVWRRILEDYNALGSLGDSADNGTLHYYNGGRKPSRYKLERYFGDEIGIESPMDLAISNAQITRPNSPVYVTETGFNIQTGDVGETLVPERVAAKYIPRLFSEFFLRRSVVQRVYLYALVDSSDHHFGLVRKDMTRRPSFYAVKNLIALLSDKGPSFTTGSLTYNLSGNLANIHHFVAQKRDGRFYLVIWQDVRSWDRVQFVELFPPPADVKLDISAHHFRTVKTYRPTALDLADPNQGVLPVRTLNAPNTVTLKVPDHVVVVEMIP